MNATRNEQGFVAVTNDDGRTVTARILCDRSMVSILATSGIVSNGDYRDDGWVYVEDKPIRKWHSRFERITFWEPKMNNLPYLYALYKKTNDKFDAAWKQTVDIMMSIWDKNRPAKAHTFVEGEWWEFEIHDHGYGLGISVNRLEAPPKKVLHAKAGKKLWHLDGRRGDLSKRCWKAGVIFFEALRRSLPKATIEKKILCLQFKDDTFVFHTVSIHPNYHRWQMFDDKYSLETKKII